MDLHHVIIEPITTEKSTMLSDKGIYVFRIRRNATKVDVKNAVKAIYDADVEKVSIIYIRPKSRYHRGRNLIVKRTPSKKAIIKIRGGKAIDITKFKEPKKSKKK